jgi:oligopeptide/dipeptide ABC transporter ATP-binding protein
LRPYTEGLVGATPRLHVGGAAPGRLVDIPGIVPPLDALPPGCPFAPRCPKAMDICRAERPALVFAGFDHRVACFAAVAEGTT